MRVHGRGGGGCGRLVFNLRVSARTRLSDCDDDAVIECFLPQCRPELNMGRSHAHPRHALNPALPCLHRVARVCDAPQAPIDPEEFSTRMRRKFGRLRAKMKADDEGAQKKTGEGTETAEEHDEDQGNSEVRAT